MPYRVLVQKLKSLFWILLWHKIQRFLVCIRIILPFLHDLPSPPLSSVGSIKEWLIWFCSFIYNILISCLVHPILNCFALHVGGRRNFGRALTAFVLTYLIWIILVLYVCFIPRRLFIWRQCAKQPGQCDAFSEGAWLITHLIFSHWFLIIVFFHYLSAIFIHPGKVPEVLPPELAPTVTMCYRCKITRPPRAHHCNICGMCVLRMDHHCPWIANCVGLYTHKHFYLSLLFMSIGGVYMLVVGRRDFAKHSADLHRATDMRSTDPPVWTHSSGLMALKLLHQLSSIYFQLALIAIPLVMGLCIWQSYLITRGETNIEYHINEKIRRRLRRRGLLYRNPYDFGPKANWLHFLGLYNPGEFPDVLVPSMRTLIYRFFGRVLLPSRTIWLENGLDHKLNIPTMQSVIDSLSALTNEDV